MSGDRPAPPAEASFLRKAGPLVLARLAGAGVTFCIPLVLARAMDLQEYGTYKQLFLIAQTLYYVLPLGMAQSLYFFIPRTGAPRPWVAQTLIFLFAAGLLGLGFVVGFTDALAALLQNPGLTAYRWELGIYVAGMVSAIPLEVIMTTQGRTKAAAGLYLGSDVLRALAMIAPVLAGFGVAGAMQATAAFAVLRFAGLWVLMFKATKGPTLQAGLLWRQVAYAAPFGAAMLLSVPQQYAHQYAVGAQVPPELFAIYAVGCFQLPLVDLLYSPTSEVLMVRVGELERQGRVRESVHAFREASAKLAFAFLPMSAFLFAAAPEFIGALFTDKFIDAVPIFQISVLAIVLSIFPVDGLLRARNETGWLFKSYLVKAVATVPLVYLGVRFLGMTGGILSWALAEVLGKGMLLWRAPRALGLQDLGRRAKLLSVVPWRDLGRASLAAVGGALAVYAVRVLTPDGAVTVPDGLLWRSLPLLAVGVVFGAGYLALLRAVGVRPLALLAALRRRPQVQEG